MPDDSPPATAVAEPINPQAGPDIKDFGKRADPKASLQQLVAEKLGGQRSTPPKSQNRVQAEKFVEQMLPPKIDPDDAMAGGMEAMDDRPVDENGFALLDINGSPIDERAEAKLIEMGYDFGEDGSLQEPKAEEAKPAETKPAEPTLDDVTKDKVAKFDFFEEALAKSPDALAAQIVQNMDPRQRASFLKELGITQTPQGAERPTFNPKTATLEDGSAYVPYGPMEEALSDRWDDIDSIPHVIADQSKLREEIQGYRNELAPNIDAANVYGQLAIRQIGVLAEALGIKFPEMNFNEVMAELADGRKSYTSVLDRRTAEYKNLSKNVQQRDRERPQDPGNGSPRESGKKDPNMSMEKIMRQVMASKPWGR